jgi:hypothetical protein
MSIAGWAVPAIASGSYAEEQPSCEQRAIAGGWQVPTCPGRRDNVSEVQREPPDLFGDTRQANRVPPPLVSSTADAKLPAQSSTAHESDLPAATAGDSSATASIYPASKRIRVPALEHTFATPRGERTWMNELLEISKYFRLPLMKKGLSHVIVVASLFGGIFVEGNVYEACPM